MSLHALFWRAKLETRRSFNWLLITVTFIIFGLVTMKIALILQMNFWVSILYVGPAVGLTEGGGKGIVISEVSLLL